MTDSYFFSPIKLKTGEKLRRKPVSLNHALYRKEVEPSGFIYRVKTISVPKDESAPIEGFVTISSMAKPNLEIISLVTNESVFMHEVVHRKIKVRPSAREVVAFLQNKPVIADSQGTFVPRTHGLTTFLRLLDNTLLSYLIVYKNNTKLLASIVGERNSWDSDDWNFWFKPEEEA